MQKETKTEKERKDKRLEKIQQRENKNEIKE